MMETRVVLLDRPYSGAELQSLAPLDLRNIDSKAFGDLLARCRTKNLRIYHIKISNLDGIERLDTVTDLTLEWAPKVTSLSPVFRMRGLQALRVRDLPRLAELDGIASLIHLRSLTLRGGEWKPLRLASLRPVASLTNLEELTVQNTRLGDDDVTRLASLPHLRSLTLSNQFDRAQVATLAKRLNQRLTELIAASVESSLACKDCGGAMQMFTGRRMPFLCPTCDRARFDKLTREFWDLVQAA